MEEGGKIRVLIAKPGLDGHERGARVIAYGLRDAGFEVIYTGLRQTPEEIARAAVEEDAHVIGLSILSGAHLSLTQKVLDRLKAANAGDIMVVVGGVIPEADIPALEKMGVAGVFTAGSTVAAVADFIKAEISKKS